MSKQEYLYNNEYVTISNDVVGDEDLVVVVNDREQYIVARRSNLKKKEDSWGWKRELERKKELQLITARAKENLESVVEEVITAATSALQARMKMNVLFGKGMSSDNGWALTIADELGKLVKEKAADVVSKKEDPFEL